MISNSVIYGLATAYLNGSFLRKAIRNIMPGQTKVKETRISIVKFSIMGVILHEGGDNM